MLQAQWTTQIYSRCSLAVSTQVSPAVDPRSNPRSGTILMSENLMLLSCANRQSALQCLIKRSLVRG